jgi:hypothetical protein
MKNKVDISKIIEEKYTDKQKETFSLKKLNEMINSVLDEGIVDFSYKRDFDAL